MFSAVQLEDQMPHEGIGLVGANHIVEPQFAHSVHGLETRLDAV